MSITPNASAGMKCVSRGLVHFFHVEAFGDGTFWLLKGWNGWSPYGRVRPYNLGDLGLYRSDFGRRLLKNSFVSLERLSLFSVIHTHVVHVAWSKHIRKNLFIRRRVGLVVDQDVAIRFFELCRFTSQTRARASHEPRANHELGPNWPNCLYFWMVQWW